MEFYWMVVMFWLGLSVGSFLNMLIYRTELRYKLRKKTGLSGKNNFRNDIGGRSFCDFCGKQLSFYDNIPVISWLVLGGKSRCCKKKLPFVYPLLELTMGILFTVLSNQLFTENWLSLVLKLIIISFLFYSAIFDFRHMILPDFSTYILIGCGFILWMFSNHFEIGYLLAGVGAALFLLVLHVATRGRGMGMGDVKYVMFMGILLGVEKTILSFYLAFIGGAVIGVGLILFLKKKKNSRMPFGPFLIAATLISWFWGEKLLLYFYSWF